MVGSERDVSDNASHVGTSSVAHDFSTGIHKLALNSNVALQSPVGAAVHSGVDASVGVTAAGVDFSIFTVAAVAESHGVTGRGRVAGVERSPDIGSVGKSVPHCH